MDELKETLKRQIIEVLNLEDIAPEDIRDDAALFGKEGLGLDSIDALELVVMLDKRHGVKIANVQEGRKALFSIDTLAEFIRERTGAA
jgi:acyl carrier protein